MYQSKEAFTLIELLVVVLIIGVLAAVALPQYQKAVNKSRLSTLIPLVSTIKEAEELYFLENGYYSGSFEDLDIALEDAVSYVQNDPGWMRIGKDVPMKVVDLFHLSPRYITEANSEDAVITAVLKDKNGTNLVGYKYFLNHSAYPNRRFCLIDKSLCESLGGVVFEGKLNNYTMGWELP